MIAKWKLTMLLRHWSSSSRRYLSGINRVQMIWTDGDTHAPVAARVYEKSFALSYGVCWNFVDPSVRDKASRRSTNRTTCCS